MTKLKLSYFKFIMEKQSSLKKAIMMGKTEGSRKEGDQRARYEMDRLHK